MADLTQQQIKLDSELSRLQQEKEVERFQLIEQLQEGRREIYLFFFFTFYDHEISCTSRNTNENDRQLTVFPEIQKCQNKQLTVNKNSCNCQIAYKVSK